MRTMLLTLIAVTVLRLTAQGGEPRQVLGGDGSSGMMMGSAMGTLYSPQCAEAPLVKQFPHRKDEIVRYLNAFNTKYAVAWRNIMNDPGMKAGMERGIFQPIFDAVKEIQESEASEMTEEDLDAYLAMLREMTDCFMKGEDSYIRKTILTALYHDEPTREMSDKCVETYYSRDNRKALGINFSIQHPISWLASDGQSEYVIQKFTSKAGLGDIEVTITVKDMLQHSSPEDKSFLLSANQDVERAIFDELKKGDWHNFAFGEEMVIPSTVETKDIMLEQHSGIRIDARTVGQRLDTKTESWIRCYMILYKGRMLMITGSFRRIADGAEKTDKTIQKEISEKTALAQKFVDLMANTFILNPKTSR